MVARTRKDIGSRDFDKDDQNCEQWEPILDEEKIKQRSYLKNILLDRLEQKRKKHREFNHSPISWVCNEQDSKKRKLGEGGVEFIPNDNAPLPKFNQSPISTTFSPINLLRHSSPFSSKNQAESGFVPSHSLLNLAKNLHHHSSHQHIPLSMQ
jgi:hypothetical protein